MLVQTFCARPKIYLHIVAVTNILCQTKRWFAFSKIVFCADTKVFEGALNAVKFLGWLKKFELAQNILGPVKGQGISGSNKNKGNDGKVFWTRPLFRISRRKTKENCIRIVQTKVLRWLITFLSANSSSFIGQPLAISFFRPPIRNSRRKTKENCRVQTQVLIKSVFYHVWSALGNLIFSRSWWYLSVLFLMHFGANTKTRLKLRRA